jgi:hypothetical protein
MLPSAMTLLISFNSQAHYVRIDETKLERGDAVLAFNCSGLSVTHLVLALSPVLLRKIAVVHFILLDC